MEKKEGEHYLAILVELDLYEIIRAIRGGKFPNEVEMIKQAINNFEKKLPEGCSQIPNVHEFIMQKIEEIDKEEEKLKIMREQHYRERRLRQQQER